jgi:hypothetical protein
MQVLGMLFGCSIKRIKEKKKKEKEKKSSNCSGKMGFGY